MATPARAPGLASISSRRCPPPAARPDHLLASSHGPFRRPPAARLAVTVRLAAVKDGSFGGPSTSSGVTGSGSGGEAAPAGRAGAEPADVATNVSPPPAAADWAAWADAPDVPALAGSADVGRIASFAAALAGDAVRERDGGRREGCRARFLSSTSTHIFSYLLPTAASIRRRGSTGRRPVHGARFPGGRHHKGRPPQRRRRPRRRCPGDGPGHCSGRRPGGRGSRGAARPGAVARGEPGRAGSPGRHCRP